MRAPFNRSVKECCIFVGSSSLPAIKLQLITFPLLWQEPAIVSGGQLPLADRHFVHATCPSWAMVIMKSFCAEPPSLAAPVSLPLHFPAKDESGVFFARVVLSASVLTLLFAGFAVRAGVAVEAAAGVAAARSGIC